MTRKCRYTVIVRPSDLKKHRPIIIRVLQCIASTIYLLYTEHLKQDNEIKMNIGLNVIYRQILS